jgi:hypothetical protein
MAVNSRAKIRTWIRNDCHLLLPCGIWIKGAQGPLYYSGQHLHNGQRPTLGSQRGGAWITKDGKH